MVSTQAPGTDTHRLAWPDFDDLAIGGGRSEVLRQLREIQRSRRLLLIRTIAEAAVKEPYLHGSLPALEHVWDLLERAEKTVPAVVEQIIAYPYTGNWAAYVTRLLRNKITGASELWVHIGYAHSLAVAAAVRSGIDFELAVPLWRGVAALPTLGVAHFADERPHAVATARSDGRQVEIVGPSATVRLPDDLSMDGPGWWAVRRLSAGAGPSRLSVRLDDVDPYRGLHEPIPPQRLKPDEARVWDVLLREAWPLVVRCLPALADGMPAGLDAIVPTPAIPHKSLSASSSEAFGSAIIALPADAPSLAATLVHEFQHFKLDTLMHLTRLHHDDTAERFYTLWRDDPRPVGGVLHGVYAFFGVTAFWRALSSMDDGNMRAWFEFGYWRAGVWRVLTALRSDDALTEIGRRLVERIADRLEPWMHEALPDRISALTGSATADHYAGWRMRHVRPDKAVVEVLAQCWRDNGDPTGTAPAADPQPTPRPDGTWHGARTELLRLTVDESGPDVADVWRTVPDAGQADYHYAIGRYEASVRGYLAELAADPDSPNAWVGLGLALRARHVTSGAARALLRRPELVREVHRAVREGSPVDPERLAEWISRSIC